jgi:hypothetical protein
VYGLFFTFCGTGKERRNDRRRSWFEMCEGKEETGGGIKCEFVKMIKVLFHISNSISMNNDT